MMPNAGQAEADRARSEYTTKTLRPMVAEAMTSPLNAGQNSTFAGGRIAALETAGAAEANRLAENARTGAIDNRMRARAEYMRSRGPQSGFGGVQEEQPGPTWLDRLPAYAQLAYGGVNAMRYASPYAKPLFNGMGLFASGLASGFSFGRRKSAPPIPQYNDNDNRGPINRGF